MIVFLSLFQASRRTDELPLSSKDLVLLKPSKTFIAYACERVLDICPQQRGSLLGLCLGYLAIPLRNSTQFDFQFPKTTNTTRSLLSFEDALSALVPDMLQLTFYWFCWIVTLPLFLESALIAQILVVLLLFFSPIFYVRDFAKSSPSLFTIWLENSTGPWRKICILSHAKRDHTGKCILYIWWAGDSWKYQMN